MEEEVLLNLNLDFPNNLLLTINEKRANKVILGIIILLASIISLIPIMSLFILTISEDGISFGLIAIWITSWTASGYLLKLYLWNKYGKEVLIISNNSLSLYYDYHYFKDNHQKYDFKSISVYIEYNNKLKKLTPKALDIIDNQESIIAFRIEDKFVSTKNKLPIEIIIQIATYLKCLR